MTAIDRRSFLALSGSLAGRPGGLRGRLIERAKTR
jgi:hypothetical protein